MGQRCSGFYCQCWPPSCVRCYEPTSAANTRYARYQSDNDVDLDNIVGDLLELDPIQTDKEVGTQKINVWMDSMAPQLQLPPSHIGISSAKCIKYWEAVQAKPTAKLSGSFVRFSFERRPKWRTSTIAYRTQRTLSCCEKSVSSWRKEKRWSGTGSASMIVNLKIQTPREYLVVTTAFLHYQ